MKQAQARVKQLVKQQRWQLRRLAVQRQYGKELCQSVPVLFGNSIPKAGSHLMHQVLMGMTKLGPFVDTGLTSVNRDEASRNVNDARILENIRLLRSGDIGYGKLHCRPPFIEALTRPGMLTLFMYRDPRDVAVSVIRYATEMHQQHDLNQHFNQKLKTDEERLHFVINGSDIPSLPYSSIFTRYENYIGWLEQPVLAMKFEDLIEDRRNALSRFLDYVAKKGYTPTVSSEDALKVLEISIQPKRSGTFRKGKTGEWRSVFSPATKLLFKEKTGDLLQRLGYEIDADW
jgi:hypothetical protein